MAGTATAGRSLLPGAPVPEWWERMPGNRAFQSQIPRRRLTGILRPHSPTGQMTARVMTGFIHRVPSCGFLNEKSNRIQLSRTMWDVHRLAPCGGGVVTAPDPDGNIRGSRSASVWHRKNIPPGICLDDQIIGHPSRGGPGMSRYRVLRPGKNSI